MDMMELRRALEEPVRQLVRNAGLEGSVVVEHLSHEERPNWGFDVMSEDFIRLAMAKGRTRKAAALHHGVRNASIPLVTVATLQLGALMAGAVVIENVFVIPGIGRLLVTSTIGREVVVVQSAVFVIMMMILTMNFLMDIAYGLLDPRIRMA